MEKIFQKILRESLDEKSMAEQYYKTTAFGNNEIEDDDENYNYKRKTACVTAFIAGKFAEKKDKEFEKANLSSRGPDFLDEEFVSSFMKRGVIGHFAMYCAGEVGEYFTFKKAKSEDIENAIKHSFWIGFQSNDPMFNENRLEKLLEKYWTSF